MFLYTFLACMFCFPNTDHVVFSREFAFCLFVNKNAVSSYGSCLLLFRSEYRTSVKSSVKISHKCKD